MNYAATEIKKFDQFANDWWDPNGPMKPLHQLNPIRLHYIQQHATLLGKHVIDVGCGAGLLSESLAKAGAIVTAIDMSEQALCVAIAHAEQQHLQHVSYQKITIHWIMGAKQEKTRQSRLEKIILLSDHQKRYQ